MTGRGHGAPPETASASDARSWLSKSGTAMRAAHIAGTMNCTVAFSDAIVTSAWAGSKDGRMTLRPPTYSSGSVCTPRTPMWNMGATVTVTSSARSPRPKDRLLTAFHRWLSWVSIAPLGRPVVPKVYIRQDRSLRATSLPRARASPLPSRSSKASSPSSTGPSATTRSRTRTPSSVEAALPTGASGPEQTKTSAPESASR